MSQGILKHMTLDQVRAFGAKVVLWPIGQVEPHGSSLPYGTDCYEVNAVATQALEKAAARVAPERSF